MPRANDRRSDVADLIADQAEAHEASVLARADGRLLVHVRLRRADGFIAPYTLKVDAREAEVVVREETPDRLPAFCPERHVNDGGGFCMTWQDAEPLLVFDEASATLWWGKLLQYLRLQERAARLGRWPNRSTWAHGDAAKHQKVAEDAAVALGTAFDATLRDGAYRVTTARHASGRFLELRQEDRRILSMWVESGRIAAQRQACLCGSGRPMRRCGDHARRAADLVAALWAWERAEAAFWRSFKDRACCGSVAGCPLAARASPSSAPGAAPASTAPRARVQLKHPRRSRRSAEPRPPASSPSGVARETPTAAERPRTHWRST